MAKKMTATEAAAKLTKAFKLDPPLPNRWSVIFRAAERLGHSARAMINADEGALVQSEALGFSNGGFPTTAKEFNEQYGTDVKEFEKSSVTGYGDILKAVTGDNSGYNQKKQAAYNKLSPAEQDKVRGFKDIRHFKGSDAEAARDKYQADYKRAIAKGNEGAAGHGDYIRGRKDVRAENFIGGSAHDATKDAAAKGADIDMGIYNQVLQGKDVGGVTLVGYTDAEGKFQPMTANDAARALEAGIVEGYGYTPPTDTPTDTPADTPAPTTPAPPVVSTPTRSAPAPDMPSTVSLEPSQEEIDRAAEVFVDDAVVLPTGSYDLPSIETPTVEAPEGTTAVDAPTFGANVQRQAEQFKQRGIDQAQFIQPQTRAEKIAAGQTAGRLEQRLYQNRQGMSTYVLGVYNSEGVWTPSQPIPQGYRTANVGQAPYLVQQAAAVPATSTDEPAETDTETPSNIDPSNVVNPQYGEPQMYFGGQALAPGYYAGPLDGVYKYGEGPYAEETQAYLDSVGLTFDQFVQQAGWKRGDRPWDDQHVTPEKFLNPRLQNQGGMIRGYDNGGVPQQSQTFDVDPLADRENTNLNVDTNPDTSSVPENPVTTPDTPTVTVADQPLTKEQVAQGQADLTAGAILDPAGTVVAPPVTQINPDTEGTVLSATTGQALTTAPIITDPAQVGQTVTADTPTKPSVSKVTTQKAEDKIKTALEGGLDVQKMLDNVKGSSFFKPEYNPETGKITIEEPRFAKKVMPRIGEDGIPILPEPLPPVKREVTPKEFADMFGVDVSEFTSQGVQAATSTGPTKTITAEEQDTTAVSDLQAAQGTAAEAVAAKRDLQEGELISGSAVDKGEVAETFGTGEVKAASMQDEMTTLMQQFEGGNTPPWAAGAMRKATAVMAQRGLGASSMAGQAIIQAAMESAIPIAQIDTANKQQMALAKAEQRAKFMQMDFDQEFQSKVMNAAKVSEIANMNFTAEQQVALENAKMAQTMNLANLNNRQALVMAEAAQISQLEMASLNNRQQAQVQNAQNFLQIDMANLNNEQQAEIFKAQTLANTILSDTAAANASEQFNASSENQTEQFFASMKSQINQFNSAQTNAMSQFNAGEANAIQKFNSELQNQREVFNSQMYAQIAQANAKWRQDTTTINTASANQSNFEFAKNVNGLTNKAIDQIWQRERDLMSFAMQSSESAMDRSLQIILGDKDLEAIRMKLDSEESAAKGSLFTRFLFGSGIEGGFGGILKKWIPGT